MPFSLLRSPRVRPQRRRVLLRWQWGVLRRRRPVPLQRRRRSQRHNIERNPRLQKPRHRQVLPRRVRRRPLDPPCVVRRRQSPHRSCSRIIQSLRRTMVEREQSPRRRPPSPTGVTTREAAEVPVGTGRTLIGETWNTRADATVWYRRSTERVSWRAAVRCPSRKHVGNRAHLFFPGAYASDGCLDGARR